MKKLSLIASGALAAAGLAGLTGCEVYVRQPAVVVQPAPAPVVVAPAPVVSMGAEVEVGVAPPAPVAEVQVAAPGADFVWVPGAWVWEGRWVWTRGRWDHPPRVGARWVPHHYEYRNGRHVFVRGGWR